MSPIRVLLVDDSPMARRVLRRHLERDPRFEVVGEAADGAEALLRLPRLQPDVVVLDLQMPKLDGRGFLAARDPGGPAVVVVSSEATPTVTRELVGLGAVDAVQKCQSATQDCLRVMLGDLTRALLRAGSASTGPAPAATGDEGLLAIGSSTGGVEALEQVLRSLPADCPPVVVSQHMPPSYTSSMARRFDDLCRVTVREAQDGGPLRRGMVWIAPGDQHLRVVRSGGLRLLLGSDAKVNGHRPSVCVMFRSIAKLGLGGVRAALLTGMGRDGAEGMLALRNAGAFTIAQDEATSVVWGMPKAAVKLGAAAAVLPLPEIGGALVRPETARAARRRVPA